MKEYNLTIDGKSYNVKVDGISGGVAQVSVDGTAYSVRLESAGPVTAQNRVPREEEKAAGGREVTSPLPGVILRVEVSAGQSVRRGQRVAVVEAMKMENDILSPCDGTVTGVSVHDGDSVLEGAKIITIR